MSKLVSMMALVGLTTILASGCSVSSSGGSFSSSGGHSYSSSGGSFGGTNYNTPPVRNRPDAPRGCEKVSRAEWQAAIDLGICQ